MKPHIPIEPIHLVGAVEHGADARIRVTAGRQGLRTRLKCEAREEQRDADRLLSERRASHDAPAARALSPGAWLTAGGATSGSGLKSTTLKPKGSQRRTWGSL